MVITRNNPKGGRKIKDNTFPVHTDKNGYMGFLLGYAKDEKILIPISLASEFAEKFYYSVKTNNKNLNMFKPKETLREKIIKLLGGNLATEKVEN